MGSGGDVVTRDQRRWQEHIDRVVAEAPPLTAEQRDRLSRLLRAGQSFDRVPPAPPPPVGLDRAKKALEEG